MSLFFCSRVYSELWKCASDDKKKEYWNEPHTRSRDIAHTVTTRYSLSLQHIFQQAWQTGRTCTKSIDWKWNELIGVYQREQRWNKKWLIHCVTLNISITKSPKILKKKRKKNKTLWKQITHSNFQFLFLKQMTNSNRHSIYHIFIFHCRSSELPARHCCALLHWVHSSFIVP